MSVIKSALLDIIDIKALKQVVERFMKEHNKTGMKEKDMILWLESTPEKKLRPRFFGTKFGSQAPECDYIIKLPGSYDIGVRQKLDENKKPMLTKKGKPIYEIIADNELFGGKYISDNYGKDDEGRKIMGESSCNLLKEYQKQVLVNKYAKTGRKLEFIQQANGGIKARLHAKQDKGF